MMRPIGCPMPSITCSSQSHVTLSKCDTRLHALHDHESHVAAHLKMLGRGCAAAAVEGALEGAGEHEHWDA